MKAWTVTNANVLPVGTKTRALLAILALSAPEPVMRHRLAELLWSQRRKELARASLRQEIHRLAEALAATVTQFSMSGGIALAYYLESCRPT